MPADSVLMSAGLGWADLISTLDYEDSVAAHWQHKLLYNVLPLVSALSRFCSVDQRHSERKVYSDIVNPFILV